VPPGFYPLIAAQFVSGLADHALLLVLIARLAETGAPPWWAPVLKLGFTLAYVLLAPFVGPYAERRSKARVMSLAHGLKVIGCALLLTGADPVLAFALVGAGAAAYSPAKYGLMLELLPPQRLVAANGWIEGVGVAAVLLGTVLGGLLVGPWALTATPWALPVSGHGTRLLPAFATLLALYGAAAVLNLMLPHRHPQNGDEPPPPALAAFAGDNRLLWRDPAARLALAVTMLYWGVGATLQLIVLRWAVESLGLKLDHAAFLQLASAIGLIAGAVLAARWIPLARATAVLPLGLVMGALVVAMTALDGPVAAVPLLALIGLCAGLFVVPMNALLQHRGHTLLSAGRSIAVQNFSENLGVLALLALYAAGAAAGWPIDALIGGLGGFVAAAMLVIFVACRHPLRRARPESP
jgi:MFS family permease